MHLRKQQPQKNGRGYRELNFLQQMLLTAYSIKTIG